MRFISRLSHAVLLFQIGVAAGAAVEAPATTQNPHGKMKVKSRCQDCHTPQGWVPIRKAPEFEHRDTGFPLRGLHAKVQCRECHVDLVFSNVGKECQDCHADIHRRKNGAQCDLCHRDTGWQVSVHSINEHMDRFPLIGAHAAVDCYSCHKAGTVGPLNRQGLSTECVSCHLDDYRKTKSPNHLAQGFSTDCIECHGIMDNWMAAMSPLLQQRK